MKEWKLFQLPFLKKIKNDSSFAAASLALWNPLHADHEVIPPGSLENQIVIMIIPDNCLFICIRFMIKQFD